MARRLASIVLLGLFALCVAIQDTTPALFWSNYNYLAQKNLELNELLTDADVVQAIQRNDNTITKYFNAASQKPEVIAIFLEPQMRTEYFSYLAMAHHGSNGGVFSQLKTLLDKSSSSLTLPYVTGTVGNSLVDSLVASLAPQATVTVISNKQSNLPESLKTKKAVSFATFGSQFQSNQNSDWEILNNGVTDLIVVCFDDERDQLNAKLFEKDGDVVSSVISSIQSANYLAVFTSGQASEELAKEFPSTHPVLEKFEQQYTQYSPSTWWPDNVIAALLIMAPFIFILAVGINCTYGVQSALRYDLEKKQR